MVAKKSAFQFFAFHIIRCRACFCEENVSLYFFGARAEREYRVLVKMIAAVNYQTTNLKLKASQYSHDSYKSSQSYIYTILGFYSYSPTINQIMVYFLQIPMDRQPLYSEVIFI